MQAFKGLEAKDHHQGQGLEHKAKDLDFCLKDQGQELRSLRLIDADCKHF